MGKLQFFEDVNCCIFDI